MERLNEWLRGRLKPLVDFKGTPHQLGLALGWGIFIGVIPGTGLIAAAFTATLLRLNLPITVAGAAVTNPLTMPFIYGSGYWLGKWIDNRFFPSEQSNHFLVDTVIGTFLLGFLLGLAGYLLTLFVGFCLRLRKPAIKRAGKKSQFPAHK